MGICPSSVDNAQDNQNLGERMHIAQNWSLKYFGFYKNYNVFPHNTIQHYSDGKYEL